VTEPTSNGKLEIVEVAPDPGAGVRGHFRVRALAGRRVEITGWTLGRAAAVREIELRAEGSVAGRAPVAIGRPDVAEKFPDAAESASAGFQFVMQAEGRGGSRLELWALLADDSREPLGRIVVEAGR
jgi:hypothetical protein